MNYGFQVYNLEIMLTKANRQDLLDCIEIEQDKSLPENFKAMLNAEGDEST